jgi:hypothetical protein
MTWIDANLAAALQGIRYRLREESGKILHLMRIPEAQIQALAAIGFLPSQRNRVAETMIPLKRFNLADHKEFAAYTQRYLANKGLPAMSDAVASRFFEGIDEATYVMDDEIDPAAVF